MSAYDLFLGISDTLASTMAAGATSSTLSTGNFGSPSGTQLLTYDYNVPAKRAVFACSVAGTAVTSMVLLEGPDVEHSSAAKVGSVFTPEHWRSVQDGTSLSATAVLLGSASITSDYTSTVTPTVTDVTGLSVTVTVPTYLNSRKIFVEAFAPGAFVNSAAGSAWDLYIRESTTILQGANQVQSVQGGISVSAPTYIKTFPFAATPGSHTYKVSFDQAVAGTFTLKAAATKPAYIAVYAC